MTDTKRQPKSESVDDLERHMEQRRLERAVIEAARAWYKLWKPDRKHYDELHGAFTDMTDALEALNKAEVECD